MINPAAIASGLRRLTRSEFDRTLAPYFRGNNVISAVGEYVLVGLTIVDITAEAVELFWVFIRPASGSEDPLFDANQRKDGAVQLQTLMRQEISKLDQLAQPYGQVLAPEQMQSDEMFNWLMRSVRISDDDLSGALMRNVALIGDAAHAMPIFAGEGGNHGLLDGVELGVQLADAGLRRAGGVAAFYRHTGPRWNRAMHGSIEGLSRLTQPIETWRRLAGEL